jgi:hypothetical protein
VSAFLFSVLVFFQQHPELIPLVVWPLITALVSFVQDKIKAHLPSVWDFLQITGLDMLGLIRRFWPRQLPPPPPASPKPEVKQ